MTLKSILNSLSCPLCKAQVDGANNYYSQFYCVFDKEHYNVWFKDDKIKRETVHIYDYSKLIRYEIIQIHFDDGTLATKVYIENIDAEGRVIFTFDGKSFSVNFGLFNFRNFNLDKAINKIKTFLVFQ